MSLTSGGILLSKYSKPKTVGYGKVNWSVSLKPGPDKSGAKI